MVQAANTYYGLKNEWCSVNMSKCSVVSKHCKQAIRNITRYNFARSLVQNSERRVFSYKNHCRNIYDMMKKVQKERMTPFKLRCPCHLTINNGSSLYYSM